MLDCATGIEAGGVNGYYADNLVPRGVQGGQRAGNFTEGHGIELYDGHGGQGTVVCYERHFARCRRHCAVHCSDADVYGNDEDFNSDDSVGECDGGGPNLRLWENRFWHAGRNGISFQPYIGGPCYLIRNIVIDHVESPIKGIASRRPA